MKIYVGGANAVGKSTILKATANTLGIPYYHGTTLFLKHLGFDGNYEKLRALTQEQRNDKLDEFLDIFIREQEGKSFLFDSHYLNIVRGETNKVSRPWLKDFDILVLVTAPAEDVWQRITTDSSVRDRALFPKDISEKEAKEMLQKYLQDTKEEFTRLTKLYNKPSVEIINIQNRIDEAVDRLVDFIKKRTAR